MYESAFFAVPIVCSSNTYLSEVVHDWGIGGNVNSQVSECFEEDMSKFINSSWIERKILNCYKVPNSNLIDDQDHVVKDFYSQILR